MYRGKGPYVAIAKSLTRATSFSWEDFYDNSEKYGLEITVKALQTAIEGGHDLSYVCQKMNDEKKGRIVCNIKMLVPKIYQKGFIEVSLFSFVSAIQKVLPSVTRTHAIGIYKDWLELGDELDEKSALKIFERMNEENYERLKTP